MERLSLSKRKWITKHASENCGIGKTLHKWNIQQDAPCPRCHEKEEDSPHVFKCDHFSNGEGKEKMLEALREQPEETETNSEIKRAMVCGVKRWLLGTQGENPNGFSDDVKNAFHEQQSVGWCNMTMGLPTKSWDTLQQKDHTKKGKRRSGKRWLMMIIKRLMEMAWDVWISRCKWRHREGNERDENSEEELNNYTREEFMKGEEGLPEHSMHLIECDAEDVIDFPPSKKRV